MLRINLDAINVKLVINHYKWRRMNMEYTDVEKQVLSLIKKADFRNIPNSNVLSYASKLNELRPEVAQQFLAQFPVALRCRNWQGYGLSAEEWTGNEYPRRLGLPGYSALFVLERAAGLYCLAYTGGR